MFTKIIASGYSVLQGIMLIHLVQIVVQSAQQTTNVQTLLFPQYNVPQMR